MRLLLPAVAVLALQGAKPRDFDALAKKAEAAFADEGLKLAEELAKKGYLSDARFVAGLVGSRVADAKEKAAKLIEEVKGSKAKPAAGKEGETKVTAFGKKFAGEWRKAAKAGSGKDAARLEVEAEILDAAWEHAKGFAVLNRRRAEAGVGTVDYDFGLAYGCQMHARYLAKYPDAGHDEDEKRAEFSEEGRNAARNSVIGGDPLDVDVERHLASLYHRTPVLHPACSRVGMGALTKKDAVTDVLSSVPDDYESHLVLYPPDGVKDVWHEFADENPSPLPAHSTSREGYPVTLIFYPSDAVVTKARAKMFEKGQREKEVECFISSPEVPANKSRPTNGGAICLIPKQTLKANTAYRVEIECELDGKLLKKDWSFATGPKAGPWYHQR
jgi:hypothetical protein